MSDHDVLMSRFIALRALLVEYVEQYDPVGSDQALLSLSNAMVLADKFPEETQ